MNLRKALEECYDHDFYLVGSQKLKTAKPDSDWDCVVTAGPGVIGFVRKLGFVSVMGGDVFNDGIDVNTVYGDNNKYVKAIVQKRCEETGVNVQIAIVADATIKVHIMETLLKSKVLRDFDLSLHGTKERNRLWDAMYELAGWVGPAGSGDYGQKEDEKKKTFVDFPVDEDIAF